MSIATRTTSVNVLAALGLSCLTSVQRGGSILTVAAAMVWASPALAGPGNLPGVGTVVKKKHGDAAIIAPSDTKGDVRLVGLAPGEYTVQVFGGREEAPMTVDLNGRLAFTAYKEIKRANSKAADPRTRRALPVVRRWAEKIALNDADAPTPPPQASGVPSCTAGVICVWSKVDLNSANADQIADHTGTSMQSAVHIVVQREKRGAYYSIEDFARRNCRTMAIEMNRGGIQIGNFVGLFLSPQAKGVATGSHVPGFQCAPRSGEKFSLYGKKHNYVGHVTLLR